jgi:hypothetical protein
MNILESLLALSNDFSDALEKSLDSVDTTAAGDRYEAASAAADLSFEHSFAVRALFNEGAPNSASGMLRLQYEALLRSAWLLFAASEADVLESNGPLNAESVAVVKKIPSSQDMLSDLERSLEQQPELHGLVAPLRKISDALWAAMGEFVQGGLHPLARTRDGFPESLAANLLKLSNGMLRITARISARLTGSVEVVKQVDLIHLKFANCLPASA